MPDFSAVEAVSAVAALFAALFAVLLAYTYVGYPLLSRLLARLFPRPVSREDIEPSVTFIIAAYNEEDAIERKLENTLALDYPRDKLAVVVASDGSTDRTHELVADYAEQGVRLFVPAGHRGKTGTANECVPTTDSEILVFSDATTEYDAQAVRMLVRNFADPNVGAVFGRVVYTYDEGLASTGFATYQKFVVANRHSDGQFGTETSVSGAIHALRSELYRPAPPELSFDMVHPLHMAQAGRRTVFEFDAVCTEEARSDAVDEYASRVRIGVRAYSYIPYLLAGLKRCRDPLFVFQVVSHKLLRWLSPLVLLGFVCAALTMALRGGVWVLPLAGVACGAAVSALAFAMSRVGLKVPGLGAPLFFATINAAFLVAYVRFINGGRVAGWAPDRGEGEHATA